MPTSRKMMEEYNNNKIIERNKNMEILIKSSKCNHTTFGIIKSKSHGIEMFELRCTKCDESLPFFFYTKKQWKERMGDI